MLHEHDHLLLGHKALEAHILGSVCSLVRVVLDLRPGALPFDTACIREEALHECRLG